MSPLVYIATVYYIVLLYMLYFPSRIIFLSLKIYFFLAKRAHHYEMPHYAAFHLGLHCLPKYLFRGFPSSKGEKWIQWLNGKQCIRVK